MTPANLAQSLAQARRTGTRIEPPPPLTLREGYAVAASAAYGPALGWKIGATSARAQAMLGIEGPIFGRILAVHPSPATLTLPGDHPAEAEPEILLRLGPGGTIAAAHLGLEIVRPSHPDAPALGPGFIVADNAAGLAVVVGPAIDPALLATPAAISVTLTLDGQPAGEGDATALIGGVHAQLAALARHAPLTEGDWIATGALARAVPLARGVTITAHFPGHGEATARWP